MQDQTATGEQIIKALRGKGFHRDPAKPRQRADEWFIRGNVRVTIDGGNVGVYVYALGYLVPGGLNAAQWEGEIARGPLFAVIALVDAALA